jgi:iron complex outermembrane recepter protein
MTALLGFAAASVSAEEDDSELYQDNPFELSPFEVSVDEMGYGSNFSTTGTRVSEAIDRLPFSVSVVTKDIMEDFLADTLEQQFAYTSAFSPGDTDLTSQIRGIAAPGRLRNGFFHYGLTDRINTRRVEVIKGPVASIYGKAQPGGILNYITETPTEQEVQRLGIYAGTNGYRRLDAVSSGPLGGKGLLYFIGVAAQKQKPPVDFAEIERLFGAASVEYRFGKSRIRAEIEAVRNDSSPHSTLPYYYRRQPDNPTGPRVADGYAFEFYNFNNMGPEAFEKQQVFTGTLTFEHAISKNANLRLAANHYDFSRERLVITGDLYLADPDPNQRPSILSRSPSFRPEDRSQSAVQGDLLLSGQWGDTEARLLITGDYSKEKTSQYFLSLEPGWDRNANHPFFFVRQLFLDDPDYRLPKVEDLTHRTRDQSTDTEIFGAFLSGQLALWRGKLIAMSGARYDYARYRTQDLTAGNFSNYSDSDSTYQIGVNFAVLPRTRLYSNYSTSFFPQARLSPEGLPYPNEQGVGYEFGIKGDIGDGKLYYTVAVFDVTRKKHRYPHAG